MKSDGGPTRYAEDCARADNVLPNGGAHVALRRSTCNTCVLHFGCCTIGKMLDSSKNAMQIYGDRPLATLPDITGKIVDGAGLDFSSSQQT